MSRSEDQLEEALVTAIEAAYTATDGMVQRLTVDYQSNGQYPYRVHHPSEPIPLCGVATAPPKKYESGAAKGAKPDTLSKGGG